MTDLLTEPGTGVDDVPATLRPQLPEPAVVAPRVPGRWMEFLAIGLVTVVTQMVVHSCGQPTQLMVRVASPPERVVTVTVDAPASPSDLAAPIPPPAATPSERPSASPSPSAVPTQATDPAPALSATPTAGVVGFLEYLKSIGYGHTTEQP